MAGKTEQKTTEPLNAKQKTVEEWIILNRTPKAVFCGVMARQGWRSGRMLTDTEYEKAVTEFLDAGMDDEKKRG